MKKWLALAVLAIVGVAGAAPALTAHRDPVNVPMFADWYTPAPDGWYTIDDAGVLSGPRYGPVSASAPVMIDVAWVGQSYGHTSAVPDVDQLRLTITKGDRTIVAQTWAQGRAAWTQVFPWDDYWVGLLGEAPPLNPSIRRRHVRDQVGERLPGRDVRARRLPRDDRRAVHAHLQRPLGVAGRAGRGRCG